MTIDEAITHCEEVAETNERICDTEPSIGLPDIYKHKDEAKKCASEHRQLAEWLKELKAYRKQDSVAISNLSMSHILNHEVKWINERMTREDNPNTCDDAISRQAVLEGLASIAKAKAKSDAQKSLMGRVMFFTEQLPSVTPQQRIGEWIEHFDEIGKWYECDQCHTDWGGPVNYCPNCGAKMEVEDAD